MAVTVCEKKGLVSIVFAKLSTERVRTAHKCDGGNQLVAGNAAQAPRLFTLPPAEKSLGPIW